MANRFPQAKLCFGESCCGMSRDLDRTINLRRLALAGPLRRDNSLEIGRAGEDGAISAGRLISSALNAAGHWSGPETSYQQGKQRQAMVAVGCRQPLCER
jgi:hypothetical protein